MAIRPQNRKPVKTLVGMLAVTLGLIGFLVSINVWGTGAYTPKLGLDLEGGQQVILKPVVREGEEVGAEQLSQAVDIMRNRVDGQGVSEAEVATLGEQITVTVPGRMSEAQLTSLQRSSQMRFRPVINVAASTTALPTTSPTASGSAGAKPSAASSATASPTAKASTTAKATGSSTANAAVPDVLTKPAATATPGATTAATTTPKATTTPTAKASASAAVPVPPLSDADKNDPLKQAQYATNEAWDTEAYEAKLAAYDCSKPDQYDPTKEDLTTPTVSCDPEAGAKYLLGPAILVGSEISDAVAGPQLSQSNGQPTGQFQVQLKIDGDAAKKYYEVSKIMVGLTDPRTELAVVLDNKVITAPRFQSAIPDGTAVITGNFTQESSKLLADQLKFGALPMSFEFSSNQDISPTLGGDSLTKGLLAGLFGLLLVVVYSLFQYRALGFVTVFSLVLVAVLTYVLLTIFGWSHNLRLTMAGITGAIVAIGTTADSFIVYFERVRDEVREGRALRAAVETGWARAKRTILISDAVNFLAAAVLYVLASSNVRGFAFMLMLTTILDVLVVFLFTHPLLTILAGTKFFGGGHKWSGFDPAHLGASTVRYVGRGRVTVADRKRAAAGTPATGAQESGA